MKRQKYEVNFKFRNEYGVWVEDYLNNNGKGFTKTDAEHIAWQLLESGCKEVKVYYLNSEH